MARDRQPPSWLPWVLCWGSLGLLIAAAALRISLPETADDTVVPVTVGTLSVALVPLVGALLASRLPSNRYGWLWCALGAAFAVLAGNDGIRRTGMVPRWVTGVGEAAIFSVILCLLVFVLLLFPTSRLPGHGWRWLAAAAVVLPASMLVLIPIAPFPDDPAEATPWAWEGPVGTVLGEVLYRGAQVMFVLILVAAGSVLVRFRRASPLERQQLKWFVLAAALQAGTVLLDVLGVPIGDLAWALLDAITFAALPVAVAIAVLRYRLYEIDRIISRTVAYGLLTGALVVLYLVVVAVLRPLLEPLTGDSTLAIAGSTLVVAAVFNPARRRLQAVVDRRFDRARYDAARAVDAFAARLRDQVDLDQVSAGLRDTVASTVAPTRVAVWLRDVPSAREA